MDEKLIKKLNIIFKKYPEISKVLLYGSRSRGDYGRYSDVDLCIFGDKITHSILAEINMDIYEIDTPLSFDIVWFNEINKRPLIENIIKDGVVIYE